MVYDTKTGRATGIDIKHIATGQYKFDGATAVGDLVVFAPRCSDQVMVYDTKTGRATGIDIQHIATGGYKFRGATAVGDLVVFAPYWSDQVMVLQVGMPIEALNSICFKIASACADSK